VRIEGPVFIGSGSRIDAGCVLRGPVWIGSGCHVEAGAVVERSVLFDYARVGSGATAHEALISGSYCVSGDGHVEQAANLPVSQRWWSDTRQPQPTSGLNTRGINLGWRV
jgi:mannose-1-phosphate guanylyltransferase